jgi:hypothetical protein
VALVEAARAAAAAPAIAERYHGATGRPGRVYICAPSDGVQARWVV